MKCSDQGLVFSVYSLQNFIFKIRFTNICRKLCYFGSYSISILCIQFRPTILRTYDSCMSNVHYYFVNLTYAGTADLVSMQLTQICRSDAQVLQVGCTLFVGWMHSFCGSDAHLLQVGCTNLKVGCTAFVGRMYTFCRSDAAQFCRSYEHFLQVRCASDPLMLCI